MEMEFCSVKKNGGNFMREWNEFLMEEDGMGVIEVILIIVVLIGLVLIFKNQLTTLINSLLSKVRNKANTV